MKRYFSFLIAASLFLFVLSCSDDGGSSGPTTDEITGTWLMQTYEVKAGGQSSGEEDVSGVGWEMTFNTDGTYEGILYDATTGYIDGEGTYKLSGNKLTLTDSDGDTAEYNIKMKGNELELISSYSYMGAKYEVIMLFIEQ